MDAAQREHWLANGWIVVDHVVSAGLLQELDEIFDRHLDGHDSHVGESSVIWLAPPVRPY